LTKDYSFDRLDKEIPRNLTRVSREEIMMENQYFTLAFNETFNGMVSRRHKLLLKTF